MNKSSPHIFVIGNEKGGAGKTTYSMHLIAGLLNKGHSVGSIDVDCRQASLTSYLANRNNYNQKNPSTQVNCPEHFHLSSFEEPGIKDLLAEIITEKLADVDYIVIDTPGSFNELSKLAHSYADTIITPLNDSFLDLDVICKINPENFEMVTPSIYSQNIWEQKMERAKRDGGSIRWFVLRNRLSNIDAINKRNVAAAVEKISKRLSFNILPGFGERVIFRELFLQGLTLLDLNSTSKNRPFSISHVAARQEVRDFLSGLGI